jgi:hypothetical protein
MKTIEDHLREAVQGEVETISATELRKHLGECLTLTSMGKSYCVVRKGKIVAFLTLAADVVHEVDPAGECATLSVAK